MQRSVESAMFDLAVQCREHGTVMVNGRIGAMKPVHVSHDTRGGLVPHSPLCYRLLRTIHP